MSTISEILKTIEENKKNLEFLKTGFRKLDAHLDGGFMRKELIVIGGHTGIGKSSLAGQIMFNMASQGVKTVYFSLEISNEMIVSRLMGAIANLKPTRVLAGLLTKEEFDSKVQAREKLAAYGDFMEFYDNLYDLSAIEKEIKEGGHEFVVVDFVQNVMEKGNDEYSRLTAVAMALQRLAKEANCCILVLSQLSNSAAREKRSRVLEYKGSGAIAMVCDLGFWIERTDPDGNVNNVRLNLRKNRRGFSNVNFDLLFKHPGGLIISL